MRTMPAEKTKPKKESVPTKSSKGGPSTKEEALEELARAVDPLIRTWKQAMAEHDEAKAEKGEAAYNKALDTATATYEKWCKAHRVAP
ncbi:MAG: hypothetical protein L3K03_08455 [Thermoplasmata archaeon]|nr:hypothetical protein [Thermoplasmata archaeon]